MAECSINQNVSRSAIAISKLLKLTAFTIIRHVRHFECFDLKGFE
ncbi:hypothetical protein SLW70_00485 [Flavobacterium sp. NG2]|nr:hypothetical protein [Flavobacterium sp. NG2]WPR71635.1 hypothetical protein SLW70_00485 [Flavobacterium sp. NG2]